MFEVINNRGKPLSELEKIKNYFIYYATIKKQKILKSKVNNTWGKILKYLSLAKITSNQDENSYLRNCYIVFFSPHKSNSWNVYKELRNKYPPENEEDINDKITEITNFINFILQAAQSYAYLFRKSRFEQEYQGEYQKEVAITLRRLRSQQAFASILPLFLAAMVKFHSSPKEVSELLIILEKLNFRIYGLPNRKIRRADSRQGHLFWCAHRFYWGGEIRKKCSMGNFDCLKAELIDFTIRNCSEETFIQSLTIEGEDNFNYYSWKGLRYFLGSYEEHLRLQKRETWDIGKILISRNETNSSNSNDYLSKEHIWAAKNRESEFPENFKQKRRLGNFVLVGLTSNIQLQNNDIQIKVKTLLEKNLNSMFQVSRLEKVFTEAVQEHNYDQTYLKFAIHLIDLRETEFVRFAIDRWKLPTENFIKFNKVDSFEAQRLGQSRNYFLKSDE